MRERLTIPRQNRQQQGLLLGVVHLLPLPGSPRHEGRMGLVMQRALEDAEAILKAGFDGYIVENFGDAPFTSGSVPPWVIAAMGKVIGSLPRGSALRGVNVLRNDARAALGLALVHDLDFIRVNVHSGVYVTDQGVISGRAAETMRDRAALRVDVKVIADVDVKHAAPLGGRRGLGELAKEVTGRGLADGIIVTGSATGSALNLGDLREVREAVPNRAILAGSGVDASNVDEILSVADGVIVGSALKFGGDVNEAVDLSRARALAAAAGRR